jgi:hypothetical protein
MEMVGDPAAGEPVGVGEKKQWATTPCTAVMPLPDAAPNQSGQASLAVRLQYEAGASAECTAPVAVPASGTEIIGTALARRKRLRLHGM